MVIPLLADIHAPDWLTPAIAISIASAVGVVSGGFAQAYISYRATKPGLRIEVCRCTHHIRTRRERKDLAGTELNLALRIHNTGQKTTVSQVELCLESFRTKKEVFRNKESVKDGGFDVERSKPYTHKFYIYNQMLNDGQLKCVCWLYHTFGQKKFKTESNLVR
jgi:hypothetical protein